MTYPSVVSATGGVVLRVFSLQKLFTLKRIQPREEEEEVAKRFLSARSAAAAATAAAASSRLIEQNLEEKRETRKGEKMNHSEHTN